MHFENHIDKCARSASLLDYFYDDKIHDYNFSAYKNDAELLIQVRIGIWREPHTLPILGGTNPNELSINDVSGLIDLQTA